MLFLWRGNGRLVRCGKPCRHWLLKPDGFGKEHFDLLVKKHSWSVLENYLRWVANEGAFAQRFLS